MEFDKDKLEKDWQERFAREEYYLYLLNGLKKAKQKELSDTNVVKQSVQEWNLLIEIFDIDTSIKTKEHYIESMKKDKAQQEWWLRQFMDFCDKHYTDILKKARVCIDRKTDKAKVLTEITKDMPERGTPQWYKNIWEINEHIKAAIIPTTESFNLQALK